jgi:signal transduction histidine kinase
MEAEFLLLISIAIMLMMALSVVFFVFLYQKRGIRHELEMKIINEQKQLELMQASIQSEEEERMRIAGELHDDVGATLSSATLFLYKAAQDSPSAVLIAQSQQLISDSLRKIRDISHKLQPATLQSLGLYASLEAYAEILSRTDSIKIHITASADLPRFSAHAELHVYRIMQELITNTLKYSGASGIQINLTKHADNLLIVVSHDGKGITAVNYEALLNKKGAIGLKNIVNRMKFIAGKIEYEQINENIFRTTLTVPFRNPEKK